MQKEYWFVGLQPDQIVDAKGDHVGFTDAGWAERIVFLHNEAVQKQCRKEEVVDLHISEYKSTHKYHE